VATIDPEKERQRLAEVYAGMSEGELEKLADDAGLLTDTAREALRAELSRRGLSIELRDSAPKEAPSKLVILRSLLNVAEAFLAKSVLDSAGIECFLYDENVVRMNWFWLNAVRGVKVIVREENVGAGADLLGQSRPEVFETDDGKYVQPRCPNCQSLDVSFQELIRSVAYGSLAGFWLVKIVPPIPLKRLGWKCHACSHAWEEPGDSQSPA
jgi:hypothetical protein